MRAPWFTQSHADMYRYSRLHITVYVGGAQTRVVHIPAVGLHYIENIKTRTPNWLYTHFKLTMMLEQPALHMREVASWSI